MAKMTTAQRKAMHRNDRNTLVVTLLMLGFTLKSVTTENGYSRMSKDMEENLNKHCLMFVLNYRDMGDEFRGQQKWGHMSVTCYPKRSSLYVTGDFFQMVKHLKGYYPKAYHKTAEIRRSGVLTGHHNFVAKEVKRVIDLLNTQ